MRIIYSSIFFYFFFSCNTETPKYAEDEVVEETIKDIILEEPFDTLEVISNMEIVESFSQIASKNETIEGLKTEIDTLELTYYFGFCDCQSWVISEIHDRANNEHSNLDDLDPRGQVQFNLDQHGFYLEPASNELEMDWRTQVNGTHIRVIGREYEEKGLAGAFTVPDPPKGRVFRYYSYEIIRPYYVWGPECVYETTPEGEDLSGPTILTVK
jgi:hypothetical protein